MPDDRYAERKALAHRILDKFTAEALPALKSREFTKESISRWIDQMSMISVLCYYLHHEKPVTTKAERDAHLRQLFATSGMTVNAFSLVHDGKHGLTRHQIRRLVSSWKCATNAQPRRRKARQNEPKRKSAKVPHDTAKRAQPRR